MLRLLQQQLPKVLDRSLGRTRAWDMMEAPYIEKTYVQLSSIDVVDLVKYLQNPALAAKT